MENNKRIKGGKKEERYDEESRKLKKDLICTIWKGKRGEEATDTCRRKRKEYRGNSKTKEKCNEVARGRKKGQKYVLQRYR